MRDDKPTKFSVLQILGFVCFGWVLLKAAVIGYYPDEVVVQIILPAVLGFALLGFDKLRSPSEE